MLPVAIDISDSIIRLVALERHGRKWLLPIRAEIPVAPGLIVDGNIQQHNEVVALVKSLVSASGVKSKLIRFALPERHSFVKLYSLDQQKNQSVDEAIRTMLPQDIPYNLDEVYWDWQRIVRSNSLGQPQVLVGAAPKSTVDEYLHLFRDAGLRVAIAELESIAIARAVLGPQPPDDTRILLDLGRSRSTLILVDRGVVQFCSTILYAGRELNQFIADELHITREQAERAKTLFGLDPKRGHGLLRTVLMPHVDALAEAVGKVETYFQEHFVDHRPIATVQLTGSGAMMRNIDTELQQRLQQTVVTAPSWIGQQLRQSNPDLPTDLDYTFTTALGLALHHWLAA